MGKKSNQPGLSQDEREARIETLVRQLSETEQALQELLADEVDAVIDPVRGTPIILRRAQAALRQSEARMRLLLDQVPALVWTTDGALRMTSIAGKELAAVSQAVGLTAEQATGYSLVEAAQGHAELAGVLAAHYRALEGQRASFETSVGDRVFRGTIEPLRDEAGRIVGCAGLGVEVIRQRNIEDVFDGKADAARRKLEAVEARGDELSPPHRALVAEILESSSVTVEELQVAAEELHQQNEELAAAHNELQTSRQRYQDLFASAPDGYLVTDPTGIIHRANRAAVELLGARQDVLRDKPLVIYVAPQDRAEFHRRLDRVRSGELPGEAEWELAMRSRANDAVFPAALTVSPIYDHQETLTGLRWLLRDISSSKRAQERERLLEEARTAAEEAQTANTLLRTLLETMPVGVVVCNADGKLLMTNPPGREILGGRVVGSVTHPQRSYTPHYPDGAPFPSSEMPLVRAMTLGEHVSGVEILIRRQDGSQRTILAGAAPVYNQMGDVVSGVTVFQDITGRKKLEQVRERLLAENRRQRTFLEHLIEATPIGVAVVRGPEHRYEMVNPSYRATLGLDRADFIGRRFADVFPTVAADGALDKMEQVYRSGEAISVREFVASIGPDQEESYWNVDLVPLQDAAGEMSGVLMVTHEVTEAVVHRREIERLAAQVERERNLLGTIMENTHAHLAYLDANFNFLMVNSAYTRGAGYARHELVGRNHFQLFPNAENQAIFERVRETGETVAFHARPFAFPDQPERGTTYWDWTLVPVKEDGQVQGMVFSLMDVTEQEQARRALQRYTYRLQGLHETDRAILAARSMDEIAEAALTHVPRLLDCVRASVMMYHHEEGAMSLLAVRAPGETRLDKGWRDAVDDAWAPRIQDMARGATVTIEDVQQAPAGSPWRDALREEQVQTLVALPLLIEDKLIGSLNLGMAKPGALGAEEMTIAREVAIQVAIGLHQASLRERLQRHTDQMEHLVQERTADLHASQVRLQAIFENAAVGIALIDPQGHVLKSNPTLQAMLGYDAQELRGMHFKSFTHPDDVEADLALTAQLMAGERDFYALEKRYICKDESVIWVNLHASTIQDNEGRIQYGVGLVEDVTARKQAQEALVQSEKLAMTGQLAASLAHEINNPLQSVIGCLGLAQETLDDMELNGELGQFIGIAHEELQRAARIVGRLRDLSRPSDGANRTAIDVNDLIERALVLSAKQLKNQHVVTYQRLAQDLPKPRIGGDRIQQVLLNLMLNAADAMPGGGELRISTHYDEACEEVVITFADTGAGMSPDILDRLFEPFFSTKSEGIGLGLFVSQNIIQEHGGCIEVESEVGSGSTFAVKLPVQERDTS